MYKKQEIKMLVLSDITDFKQNDILIELDRISRRHYDLVVVIGDVSDAILTSLNSLFETSLTALLPKSNCNYFEKTDGIEKFNLKKYHFSSLGTILGYGSDLDNSKPVDIDKYTKYTSDILVSYYPPKFINQAEEPDYVSDANGHMEVNKYIAYQNPYYIIHGGRKCNQVTKFENGTEVISVYGLQEIILKYKKPENN